MKKGRKSMFKLLIEDDEGQTTKVPLTRNEISIGRDDDNSICLHERNVSRKHAKLVVSNENVKIVDLDSYNGVWRNGERILSESIFSIGDLVEIGDFHLSIYTESQDNIPAYPSSPHTKKAHSLDSEIKGIETRELDVYSDDFRKGKLVVLNGSSAGKEYSLQKNVLSIGRDKNNTICLDDVSISKHHARILVSDEGLSFEDLGSSNGILLNGEQFSSGQLQFGDILEIGTLRLQLFAQGEKVPVLFSISSSMEQLDAHINNHSSLLKGGIAVGIILLLGTFWVLYNPNKSTQPQNKTLTTKEEPSLPEKKTSEEELATAKALFEKNNYKDASAILKRLLDEKPTWKEPKKLLAQIQAEEPHLQKLTEAATLFAKGSVEQLKTSRKILSGFPKQSKHFPNASDLLKKTTHTLLTLFLQKTEEMLKEKKYFLALQWNSQALEIDPKNEMLQTRHKTIQKKIEDPHSSEPSHEEKP